MIHLSSKVDGILTVKLQKNNLENWCERIFAHIDRQDLPLVSYNLKMVEIARVFFTVCFFLEMHQGQKFWSKR